MTTRRLTVDLTNILDQDVAGRTVTLQPRIQGALALRMVAGGLIVPDTQTATTGSDGIATFDVLPHTAFLDQNFVYRIDVDGTQAVDFVMPDHDTTLDAIMRAGAVPVPSDPPNQHGWLIRNAGVPLPGMGVVGVGYYELGSTHLDIWDGQAFRRISGGVTADQLAAVAADVAQNRREILTEAETRRDADNALSGRIDALAGGGREVADGSITTAKLADQAVTNAKLAFESVGPRELQANSVRSGHIADNSITDADIGNNQIGTRHIRAGNITQGLLDGGAVGTPELIDASVTEAKLAQAVRDQLGGGGITPEQAAAIAANTAAVRRLAQDKQDNLTQAQLVDLLQFDVVPGVVVGYTLAEQPAARRADWLTDWRVWVSGGDTVGDVWLSIRLEGQALLAVGSVDPGQARTRVKLDATNTYQFTLSDAQRTNLIDGRSARRQGRDIEVGLFFYDAANGGNVIDSKTLAVDWLPSPAASGGLNQAQVDARVNALRPSGWAQIGRWGSTAGLLNNTPRVIAPGANPTVIIPRNSQRLPAGVLYDNNTGVLTLPVGVWHVTGRAEFAATDTGGRPQRAEVHMSLRADVEGPTAAAEIAASSGYWREDPGGALDTNTTAIVPVVDLGGGNDTVAITLNGQFDRDANTVTLSCTSAVIEVVRIA